MAVKQPIDTAMNWLKVAQLAFERKIYEQSIYALEMSVEIAFKAVLLSVKVEAPRVHDIRKVIDIYLAGNRRLPKTFTGSLDSYLSTFDELLKLRPFVGYGFESEIGRKELDVRAKRLLSECSRLVAACGRAIKGVE